MQFKQFLSNVNSLRQRTNGQRSVKHDRQRWTEHGEHVRQLTHVVSAGRDVTAVSRVDPCPSLVLIFEQLQC